MAISVHQLGSGAVTLHNITLGSACSNSAKMRPAGVAVMAFLLMWVAAAAAKEAECHATSEAVAALQSDGKVAVQHSPGVGYGFVPLAPAVPPFLGGPNVSRGVVVVPEDGVAPEAYAPLARELALRGSYAVVVEKACPGRTVRAMMEKSHLQYWVLAGHGQGGALAARLARTLEPKVKGVVLMAAPMPPDVDMADLNVVVVVLYGRKDSVVSCEAVEKSFSRMPGDSAVTLFPNLSHYDFASCECGGNRAGRDRDFGTIVTHIFNTVALSSWEVASEKALSFFDNHKLTPGHNDSKPYPGDIRVQCTRVPTPNSSPQRWWWVFTPTEIQGGLVYYPGAAVDARAYFPLAFEIAARGHLVVIVQMPMRIASLRYQDANIVIDSKHPLFSGVPKGKWAVGGHSAGGFASTQYAGEFGDRIYAAAMHAGGWGANLTRSPLPVANIYGTLDGLGPGGYDRYRYRNTEPPPKGQGPLVNLRTSRFVAVPGANHYQVGDYGYQSPDQVPVISMERQVSEFARATVSFLEDAASGEFCRSAALC